MNKIIIGTGIFLQENPVCSEQDIQDFLIQHFDEIRIELKEIKNCLEVLVLAGFLEKIGELYSPKIFTIVKQNKTKVLFDQTETKLWNMEA